jgi:5-methylcytosine-specific restriction endonuclease McrA
MKKLAELTDEELILSLKSLAGGERGALVSILKHLSEFEKRRLAEERSFPSLFEYCVRELRYAQGEAFRRIRAARAADKYRILYPLIGRGALNLTTVALLEPHLKWGNYRRLIRSSVGRSTREVEALLASLTPVAAAPAERIRFLSVEAPVAPVEVEDLFASPITGASPAMESAPSPDTAVEPPPVILAPSTAVSPNSPAAPAPVAPPASSAVRRVLFSFTADESLLKDVERAKALSRHKWPAGRYEDVFAGAVKALLEKIDPDRRERRRDRARRLSAGARSRNIAAAVKDAVWRRDAGRCVYEAPDGKKCGSRAGLEFDHARPWALGGSSTDPDNVRLLCRAHNDLEARRVLGDAVIDAAVARRRGALRGGAKI